MKVVLDTNVIIAAFATHGLCHLLVESALAHHEIVLSPALLTEIHANLKKKVKLPDERIKLILRFLQNHSVFIKDKKIAGIRCRDHSDIKVLALAINGGADVIVTGDEDLLVLKNRFQVDILSPREFWERLRTV